MRKILTIFFILTTLAFATSVFGQALRVFVTGQGGTGTSSPSGILYGDSSNPLKTVTIGDNLTFSGGILTGTATGVGSATSTEPLMASWFVGTSTTATSTFSGGFSSASSLYVLQNGRVGIGTSSPTDRLHVDGNVRFSSYGSGIASFNSTGDFASGQVDLASQVSGDLPVSNLNGGADATPLTFWRGDGVWVTPDHGDILGLTDDDHSQYALLLGRSGGQSLSGGTVANDDFTLQGTTNSTRTTSYVLLQPTDGNVGIGTTSPYAKLSVAGLAVADSFNATNTAATSTFSGGLLAATGGGNVGIGTTAPGAKLHSLSTTEQLRLGYDASNYLSATVASDGSVVYDAVGSGASNSFSDAVRINAGGGTSNPFSTSVLDVTSHTNSTDITNNAIRAYAQNRTQYTALGWKGLYGTHNIEIVPGSVGNIDLGVTYNSQGGISVGPASLGQTANGRLFVTGNPVNTTDGTGTVSATAGGTTITGSSTNFATVIGIGYTITIGSDVYVIREVTSATSLKIYGTITTTVSGSAWGYTKPTLVGQDFSQGKAFAVNSLGQTLTESATAPSTIFHLGSLNASTQSWITRVTTSNNNRFEIRNDTDNTTPFYIDGNTTSSTLVLSADSNVGIGTTSPYAKLSVAGDIVGQHLYSTSTLPVVTSCGTSPSTSGSDGAGRMTVGSTIDVDNICNITFSKPWTSPPSCISNNETRVLLSRAVATTGGMTIDVAATLTDGDVYSWICLGN